MSSRNFAFTFLVQIRVFLQLTICSLQVSQGWQPLTDYFPSDTYILPVNACHVDRLGRIGIHQCSEIVPYYHSLTVAVYPGHFVYPSSGAFVTGIYASSVSRLCWTHDGVVSLFSLVR